MSGVMNHTARQYNMKTIGPKGHRVTVRLAPGFNVVKDEHWKHFLKDKYALSLNKDGLISFGTKEDDMILEREPDTESKSKSERAVSPQKGQDQIKEEQAAAKAAKEAKEAQELAAKETKEAKEATAKAETAIKEANEATAKAEKETKEAQAAQAVAEKAAKAAKDAAKSGK